MPARLSQLFKDHAFSALAGVVGASGYAGIGYGAKSIYEVLELTHQLSQYATSGIVLLVGTTGIVTLSASSISNLTDKFRWSSALGVPAIAAGLILAMPADKPVENINILAPQRP